MRSPGHSSHDSHLNQGGWTGAGFQALNDEGLYHQPWSTTLEAHRRPFMEDISPKRGPLSTSLFIWSASFLALHKDPDRTFLIL